MSLQTVYEHHRKIAEGYENAGDADSSEKRKYYINTSHLVFRYYDTEEQTLANTKHASRGIAKRLPIHIINSTENISRNYKKLISPSSVYHIPKMVSSSQCSECHGVNTQVHDEANGITICSRCSACIDEPSLQAMPAYKTPRTSRSTMTLYKRINHFNDWISQFQAKECLSVPDDVYHSIVEEIKRRGIMRRLTCIELRKILRKLGHNKFYEHVPRIMHRIQGTPPPKLDRTTEERLRSMFRMIQEPFMKHSPPNRKNFLSYSFVLRKFVTLLGRRDLEDKFPLLKSRMKLYQQDIVWRNICKDLNWRFDPSI